MTRARHAIGSGNGNPEVRCRVDRAIFNRMVEEARKNHVTMGTLARSIIEGAYHPSEIDVIRAVRYLNASGFDVTLRERRKA